MHWLVRAHQAKACCERSNAYAQCVETCNPCTVRAHEVGMPNVGTALTALCRAHWNSVYDHLVRLTESMRSLLSVRAEEVVAIYDIAFYW